MAAKKKPAVKKTENKTPTKTNKSTTAKSKKGYFSRVIDAAGEATEAGETYVKSKYVYDRLPAPMKTPQRTKDLQQMKNQVRQERGQYFGALLQGRQYDSQGKLIKKAKKK